MAKDGKKKGNTGKTVAGAGVLAIIAALLGLDPMGWGIGLGTGTGTGTGDGTVKQEQQNDDYLMQDDQIPTVIPAATVTPVEEQQENPVIQVTELAVTVSGSKVVHSGAESTAQELADKLAAEYADALSDILVKVTLEEAVYNTVDELKSALENKGIKYEIAE